jgi:hypothetical protein
MKTEACTLTLSELSKFNLEALENFKKGDQRLLADNPLEVYSVQTLTAKLICEILKGISVNCWEAVGIAETVKIMYFESNYFLDKSKVTPLNSKK